MRSTVELRKISAALVSIAALFVSTGVVQADAGHAHNTAVIGEPAKAAAAKRTIQIPLGDNFFKPDTINVKQGDVVKFVVKNTGEFLHEFNLGTAAMHAAHQKEMAMMAEHGMLTPTGINHQMMNMDHSNMGAGHAMKHDEPNSVLVGPGETKELVWKFSKAAELEFACNIPGHYESGMVGQVKFQR